MTIINNTAPFFLYISLYLCSWKKNHHITDVLSSSIDMFIFSNFLFAFIAGYHCHYGLLSTAFVSPTVSPLSPISANAKPSNLVLIDLGNVWLCFFEFGYRFDFSSRHHYHHFNAAITTTTTNQDDTWLSFSLPSPATFVITTALSIFASLTVSLSLTRYASLILLFPY